MQLFGDINQEGLALMGGAEGTDGEAPVVGTRVFDSDGDGRNDLVLVDSNNDGKVEGVVRSIDSDGDGRNDTFIQYNEDGSVASIGRVNPMTGQFEVVYEEPDLIDKILDFLGLNDLDPPEAELFTTFDDPYLMETFGTYGVEAPDVSYESVVLDSSDIVEVPEEEWQTIEDGVTVVEDQATLGGISLVDGGEGVSYGDTAPVEWTAVAEDTAGSVTQTDSDSPAEEPSSSETSEKPTPMVVGIEDRSGGEGSSLWAKVDMDGDRLADTEAQISKGGVGEYYADINQDGYSETVAHDQDMDGRIDTVDTTGKGSSIDQVDAAQVVDPASDHLIDKHHGEDDGTAAAPAEQGESDQIDGSWEVADIDVAVDETPYEREATDADDGGSEDAGACESTSYDSDITDGGATYDAGSIDAGTSYDAGSSSSYDSSDSTGPYDPDGSV
ncbi:MAG TPA: hypothetical protein DCR97_07625 [Deltaproteobacteria bacterium]|nr:hypothetical protein [Deltaproteobacteria bacterium]